MALKRGQIQRGRCRACGAIEVTAYVPDPARPLEVMWLCRDDRCDGIERILGETKREAERQAWEGRRAAALAGLALLPPVVAARLQAQAQLGAGNLRLSTEAPLYKMNLVRLYERHRDEHACGGSALRTAATASETT
jgi:hypothetical protein